MLRSYQRGCVPEGTYQKPGHRTYDMFFHQYTGKDHGNEDLWICGHFCPDLSHENRIAYGSDLGNIGFGDARKGEPPRVWKNISRNSDIINCIKFIPNFSSRLVAAAGEGNLYVCEPECGKVLELNYTSDNDMKRVKSISFHKDEPYVFIASNAFGQIFLYDLRIQKNLFGESIIYPRRTFVNTHLLKYNVHVSVDSIVHISKNIIASGSSDYESGIRFWDIRFQKEKDPLLVKSLPYNSKVYDMCIDRSGDKLFVLTSSEKILEYDTGGGTNPITAYKYPKQRVTKVNMCYSPTSDHLLVGNSAGYSYIYDLQKETYHGDLLCSNKNPVVKDYSHPRFRLPSSNGHEIFSFVDWSCNGRYMLNLTADNNVIWDNQFPDDAEFTPLKHNVEKNAVTTMVNGRQDSLERFLYDDEYSRKIKDPKWNYSIARRIGLKEVDMNVPANILEDEENQRAKSSSLKFLDLSCYFHSRINAENQQPINAVLEGASPQ